MRTAALIVGNETYGLTYGPNRTRASLLRSARHLLSCLGVTSARMTYDTTTGITFDLTVEPESEGQA